MRKNRFQYGHGLQQHHTAFHLADDKKYRDEAAVEEGEGWIVGCPSSGAFACGGGGHLY